MNMEHESEVEEFEAIPVEHALTSITKGEVDIQVSTAKRFPRSIKAFKERALALATLDQETAESMFYTLPARRGGDGKKIEGESIRLAEVVASCWGNIRAEARVVDEGPEFITAQATVWDMETNALVRIETRRRITDKNGRRYGEDMRAVTGNAAAGIALRTAVFKVVPKALVRPIYLAAKRTAVGDVSTLAERRAKAMQTFAKAGVKQSEVYSALGIAGLDDIGLPELETLLGYWTAIQDGSATIDSIFRSKDEEKAKPGAEGLKARMGLDVTPAEEEPPSEGPDPLEDWLASPEHDPRAIAESIKKHGKTKTLERLEKGELRNV